MPSQLNQRMPVHDPFIILTHKNKNIKKKEQTLHRSIQLDILVRKWSTVLLYFFFFLVEEGGLMGGEGSFSTSSLWLDSNPGCRGCKANRVTTRLKPCVRVVVLVKYKKKACVLLYLLSTQKKQYYWFYRVGLHWISKASLGLAHRTSFPLLFAGIKFIRLVVFRC